MAPDLGDGDELIIDPHGVPKPGDFVLARREGEAVLRRYDPHHPEKPIGKVVRHITAL